MNEGTKMSRPEEQDNQPQWDKYSIKAAIHRSGMTMKALEERHGLNRHDISNALDRPFPKADHVISRHLNVPLHELWPDRYDEAGVRIRYVKREGMPSGTAEMRLRMMRNRNRRARLEVIQGAQV
jgi:Ner family transcriptional regulator